VTRIFIRVQPAMRPPSLASCRCVQTRSISSSPYGRTHVWKRRLPALPNPVVPKYPQLVIRADGSSFTHWTTSPRSIIKLTRDVSNNPVWNTGMYVDDQAIEDEATQTGSLGRFNRRFAGVGGAGQNVEWMAGTEKANLQGELVDPSSYLKKKVKTKKK
jgi:hypothetical protein